MAFGLRDVLMGPGGVGGGGGAGPWSEQPPSGIGGAGTGPGTGATLPASSQITPTLISIGAGWAISEIGTLLSKGPAHGFATVFRDPVAPWEIIYGRKRIGGTMVYANTFGGTNEFLDMVMVLADHPCQSVDEVLFNQQRLQIDSTTGYVTTAGTVVTQFSGINPLSVFVPGSSININGRYYTVQISSPSELILTSSAGYTTSPVPYFGGGTTIGGLAGSGTSFNPANIPINIRDISKLPNPSGGAQNVVTVTLEKDIPYLQDGDFITVTVQNNGGILGPGPNAYNVTGTFAVTIIGRNFYTDIIHANCALQFTYICAGNPKYLQFQVDNEGQVVTNFVGFGDNVYFEYLLGYQILGDTFAGMLNGTIYEGGRGGTEGGISGTPILSPPSWSDEGKTFVNPWTASASLVTKTAVMLRLQYGPTAFAAGLPDISFLIHGKCDIYDPRLGPLSGIGTFGISNAGSGYSIGNLLYIVQDGASGGAILVTAVSAVGAITGAIIAVGPYLLGPTDPLVGTGYSIANGLNTSNASGGGSGATIDIFTLTGAQGCNVYTENPALCIADFLTNQVYGYKLKYDTDVPLAELITAANICDVQVPLANPITSPATTEPLYSLNGSFTLREKRSEILSNMLSSMAGRISIVGGKWYLWPGAWMGTTATVTSDGYYYPTGVPDETFSGPEVFQQAIAPFRWKSKVPVNQLYNAVKGTYISQVNKWMAADFPAYAQDALHGYSNGAPQYDYDANLTMDQGDRRYLDIQLPFTISCSMAQRIAKIELLRRRQQGTGTFTGNMSWYPIVPMDVIAMDLTYFQWTAKLLEVLACRMKVDPVASGGSTLSVEIDVQETSPEVYEWYIFEELSASGFQQTTVGIPTGGIVDFVPQRPKYGEIAWTNITVTGAVGQSSTVEQLDVYAIWVDETKISQFFTLATALTYDPTNPTASATATIAVIPNPVGVTQWGPSIENIGDLIGTFFLINDPTVDPNNSNLGEVVYQYEIFQLTSIDSNNPYLWTIQRNWPGAGETEAIFESFLANHATGLKIYPLQTTHFYYRPSQASLSATPPSADGSAGPGTGVTVPSLTEQLPSACVVAMMAAASNDVTQGPWTVYNCAAFDWNNNLNADGVKVLPVLPGIRTLDGSSYTLPQFNGPIPGFIGSNAIASDGSAFGLTMPTPWTTSVWASVRSFYCTVNVPVEAPGGTVLSNLEVHLQISFVDDPSHQWYLIGKMFISPGQTQSWIWPDVNPAAGSVDYPPPTIYNNPINILLATNQTLEEVNWPAQSYLETNSDNTSIGNFRPIEGDALIRWVVINNGGASIATTTLLPMTNSPSAVYVSLANVNGMADGDYLQIDSEIMLIIDIVNGIVQRGVLGTNVTAHGAGATATDISANAPEGLTVVLQT